MASTATEVVLFGGIDSDDQSIPPAEHNVLAGTWQWNGTAWTQVQDMGPGRRWLHALVADSAGGRLVIFGGLSLFALSSDPTFASGLLRDTWESATATGGAAGVSLASLNLEPTSVAGPGEQVAATFVLTGPAPGQGVNLLAGAFASIELGEQLPASQIDVPSPTEIPSGEVSGQFFVTRGPDPLEPGEYIIAAAVEGTSEIQMAPLQVLG
jgi:hypothetical protein